jgi:peptidylprolyl isomerase
VSSRFAIRRIGAVLVAAAVVAGCSSAAGTDGNTSTKITTDLGAVEVTGKPGAKPVVNVHAPFSTTATNRRVLTTGTGNVVTAGQRITIDYLGVNGTDAKEFDTSFGKADRATFTLDDGQIIKGMVQGLSGVPVGSRVLIAVPPKDGYGTTGAPDAGIGPTDTLLFVVDIKSASTVLKRATGTPVKPKAGLPTVTLDKKTGKPTITLPKSKAPATLVVQPLINGNGPKVVKAQTITVHYTGVIWPGGKVFDSSWTSGSPASFPIGVGRVIAGWDQGLVGKKVGSQVLLVIPPDKGYGVAGKAEAGIKGTDTLVFVVDILDAAS